MPISTPCAREKGSASGSFARHLLKYQLKDVIDFPNHKKTGPEIDLFLSPKKIEKFLIAPILHPSDPKRGTVAPTQ